MHSDPIRQTDGPLPEPEAQDAALTSGASAAPNAGNSAGSLGLLVALVVLICSSVGGVTFWLDHRAMIEHDARRQAKLASRGLAIAALPEADERGFLVHPRMMAKVNGLRCVVTYVRREGELVRTQVVVPPGAMPMSEQELAKVEATPEFTALRLKQSPLTPMAPWVRLSERHGVLGAASRLDPELSGSEGVLLAVIDDGEVRRELAWADVHLGVATLPALLVSMVAGLVVRRAQARRASELARLEDLNSRLIDQSGALRVSALQQQRASERLALVISGTRDGTWEHEAVSGHVELSDRLLELLSYERGTVPGSWAWFMGLVHPEDAPGLRAAIKAHNQTRSTLDCEIRMSCADGEQRWFRLRGQGLWDASGGTVRLAGSLSDIHANREAEQRLSDYAEELWASKQHLELQAKELKSAQVAAEAASRIKSEFLANMSHEIRTPMTAVVGYADLLLDARQTPAERADCVHTIRRSGQHLLALVNDILDLSKIEAGRMTIEAIDASPLEVVDESMTLMLSQASAKGVSLGMDVLTELPVTIRTDPTRLRQVLVNLLSNAVKFTEAGGVRVILAWEREAGLRLEVHDTGIGMTREQLTKLFVPFSQADGSMTRRFGGTGLGLCITGNIVRMMGGRMEVASTPGEGSTFTVRMPGAGVSSSGHVDAVATFVDVQSERVRLRALRSVPPLMPAEEGQRLDGVRVLLAEDGPDNQRLIGTLLRRAGAGVTIMANGQLAYEAAAASLRDGEPFDVVLMDMQMPVLDGYAATGKLRAAGWRAPIVALTAHALEEDRGRCLRAGCDDYATKPINRAALIALVAHWAQQARAEQARVLPEGPAATARAAA